MFDVMCKIWDPILGKHGKQEERANVEPLTEQEADAMIADLATCRDPEYRGQGQAMLSVRKAVRNGGSGRTTLLRTDFAKQPATRQFRVILCHQEDEGYEPSFMVFTEYQAETCDGVSRDPIPDRWERSDGFYTNDYSRAFDEYVSRIKLKASMYEHGARRVERSL